MRYPLWISLIALAAAVGMAGCRNDQQNTANNASTARVATLNLPSGTSIDVTLGTTISSKDAGVGDAWTGSVSNGREGIPAGSVASGTVSAVKAAQKGDRAMLDLALSSITVEGHRYSVHGSTEAIVAGSTRARNLGAIAGSAAGGALIGKAVSGTGKGALIGGLIGGGVATGVVASSDGYQVVLKQGTPLTFTTSQAVAVRQ